MDSTVLIESLRVDTETDKQGEKAWGKLIPTSRLAKPLSLHKESTTFGRADTCDVMYSQGGVSGLHCTITRGGEVGAWVTDHSTNGTFINGERIGKGNKKLLEPNTSFDLLFKGKGDDLSKPDEGDEGPKQHYYISKVLGTGNFATVKLCIHKETGDSYALKIIEKKKFLMSNATRREDALMDEVRILQRLQHPNIIGIHEVFDTETTLYLVLELVTGGELFDKIIDHGSFTEERSRNYFKQMLEATNYLHQQDIAHRDLKPENILLKDKDSDIIKLSDFGLSRTVDGESFMKTMCGTPQYVAPEILTSSKTGGYGIECDIWSLGVILYIMLVGYPPFNTERPEAVFEQIKTGRFDFPPEHWSEISQDVQSLIRRMLTVDPKKRITAKEILEHSWVKGEPPSASGDSKRKRDSEEGEEGNETPEQKRRKTEENK